MSTPGTSVALVPIVETPVLLQPVQRTRAKNDRELVASWLANMHSETTRTNFAITADRFLASLADVLNQTKGPDSREHALQHAAVEDIRDAINALYQGKARARSTIAQYTQRVKSLISYAHRQGYLLSNVGVDVRMKGGSVDRAKRIVTERDIGDLIRAAPSDRDRLLIEVAYAGGLRVSEIVSLHWTDVLPRDKGRVQLSVLGKGDTLRHVLLPAVVSETLLANRGDAPDDAPVFASRKGGASLTTRAVNYMIKRAAEDAGVNPKISAHWLRHSHATHALRRKANVIDVQATLGHKNIATTNVYLHSDPDNSSGLVLDESLFAR